MRICFNNNNCLRIIDFSVGEYSLNFSKETNSLTLVPEIRKQRNEKNYQLKLNDFKLSGNIFVSENELKEYTLISWEKEDWKISPDRLVALYVLDAFMKGEGYCNLVAMRAALNEKTESEIASMLRKEDKRLGVDFYSNPASRKSPKTSNFLSL